MAIYNGEVSLKDTLSPEEWRAYRSEVNRRYAHSPKGRATQARTNASPLAKARYARYRLTEKYRASQERRVAKDKALGWPQQIAHKQKTLAEHPEKIEARYQVQLALMDGRLERPASCSKCGAERKLHAHHHRGYDPEHALDIVWLCVPCHRAIH